MEEDLAAIFGRGRIVLSLENQFRHVVNIASFTPLHGGSEIVLDARPAATIRRALREGHIYMATAIQLSFLGFIHEETTFASVLHECMQRRYELKVPDATPDPDYDGILGAIQACNSQTSLFPWENLLSLVEGKFPKSAQWFQCFRTPLKRLSIDLLLGAMDYLYLVQSLPEDRVMVVTNQMGLVPIVVWAHYILGLEVLVKGSPDGDIQFGKYTLKHPQVVVHWSNQWEMQTHPWEVKTYTSPAVHLLDGRMEIILTTDSNDDEAMKLEGLERIRLRGYGTTYLKRYFNRETLLTDNDPIYTECVQLIIALAMLIQKSLRRPIAMSKKSEVPEQCYFEADNLHVLTSAELLFSGIKFDRKEVSKYHEKLKCTDLNDAPLPPSVRAYFENIAARSMHPPIIASAYLHRFVRGLASVVLAFAQVVELEACSDLLLLYSCEIPASVVGMPWSINETMDLAPSEWFMILAELIVGSKREQHFYRVTGKPFLVCHRGWSLFPNCIGDHDPGIMNPGLLSIKRGVPTNIRNNERKYVILDAPPIHFRGNIWKPAPVDQSQSYLPRCVTPVIKRTEMYSSRSGAFWLLIRFDIDQSSSPPRQGEEAKFSMFGSYLQFQEALCGVVKTVRCAHADLDPKPLQLDLGVITAKGFVWALGEDLADQRICILLVRDDSRARWLAVCNLMMPDPNDTMNPHKVHRSVMLRCPGCCDDCAVKSAGAMPGKWLVIL